MVAVGRKNIYGKSNSTKTPHGRLEIPKNADKNDSQPARNCQKDLRHNCNDPTRELKFLSIGALTTLFWVHVFRHVAFQIFSAQKFGLEVPDKVRNQIAYGDVATSVLGFIAIAGLHFEWSFAILLVWIFSVVSVADLVNAMIGGIRSNILDKAYGGHLTNTQLLCPSVMDNAGFDFLVAAGMRYRVNYQ